MSSQSELGRGVQWAVGAVGVGLFWFWVVVWRRVLLGPGDDNPVGLFAAWGVALSLIPAWGIGRGLLGRSLTDGKVWLLLSFTVIALLGCAAIILL